MFEVSLDSSNDYDQFSTQEIMDYNSFEINS